MKKKRVVVTGATGQDGSYLVELLLEKDYEVCVLKRKTSSEGYGNISHLVNNVEVIEGDLLDQSSLNYIVKHIMPDEIYHLGAQSHVGASFSQPLYTAEATGLSTLRLLEAVKEFSPKSKFYNAATSELFGGASGGPYDENSKFHPRSPYAIAKQFGYYTTVNYREAYKIFATNGLLFNHSSPRRGVDFATRKITQTAAKIKLGLADKLSMGNVDTYRDESHAKDMVYGMWLMLQQDVATDYVLASGESHSIREMIQVVFEHLDLDYKKYLTIDPKFFRPAEVNVLLGNPTKAKKELGWEPKYNYKQLLIEMVDHDLELLKIGK